MPVVKETPYVHTVPACQVLFGTEMTPLNIYELQHYF